MISVTLKSVAKLAGVSVSAASLVLNSGNRGGLVRKERAERIRAVASQLGYVGNYHARAMQLKKAETLGFTFEAPPNSIPLSSMYFQNLSGGVEIAVRKTSYNMVLIHRRGEENAVDVAFRQLQQGRIDALVAVRAPRNCRVLTEQPKLPIVIIEPQDNCELPVVTYDEIGGVALGVNHLVALGHRDILWLTPSGAVSREQAFVKAVWDARARGQVCYYSVNDPAVTAEKLINAAEASVSDYLAKGHTFTAVFGYNDFAAIGAQAALMRAGRPVPQSMSVLGFDNTCAHFAYPRLSTIDHRLVDMGTAAAELALQMAESPESIEKLRGHREVLQLNLIERASTGPALFGNSAAR